MNNRRLPSLFDSTLKSGLVVFFVIINVKFYYFDSNIRSTLVYMIYIIGARRLEEKFMQIHERSMSYRSRIKIIHDEQADLVMKIKFFISDLTSFNQDAEARDRLNKGDQYYMSDIYFSTDERDFILKFPTLNGLSFMQHMELTMQSKAKNGSTEICAAHDLAPMFIKVFEIQKGFKDEKSFKDAKKKFIKSLKT